MARATKTPSGSWRCLIYDGKDSNGKRIYKSFTARTKREAESQAALYAAEREDRQQREEEERRRASIPTLDAAIAQYIATQEAQGYSPSTILVNNAMRRAANRFMPAAMAKRVDEITLQDIQMGIDAYVSDTKAIQSARRMYAAVISPVLKRYCPQLNTSNVILPKAQKKAKMILRQSMAAEILRYVRENFPGDFYIYTLVIICAGCRPSEIYALTWGDLSPAPMTRLDGEGRSYQVGTISISKASVIGPDLTYHEKAPKSEAGTRDLTVSWSFFEELYRMRPDDWQPEDRIVQLRPNRLTRRWYAVRDALGLPEGMRFYDLRHYFATHIKSAGASDEELAASMGHSTPAFTHRVYVEIFEEDRNRVSRAMATSTAKLLGEIRQPAEDQEAQTPAARDG